MQYELFHHPALKKCHLAVRHWDALAKTYFFYSKRPNPVQYDKDYQRLGKVAVAPRPKPRGKLPNTLPGYEPGEYKLEPKFLASRDLPEGWAAVPLFDSGNNHALIKATVHLWCHLYNAWSSTPEEPCVPLDKHGRVNVSLLPQVTRCAVLHTLMYFHQVAYHLRSCIQNGEELNPILLNLDFLTPEEQQAALKRAQHTQTLSLEELFFVITGHSYPAPTGISWA